MIVGRLLVGYFIHQSNFKNTIITFTLAGIVITTAFPLLTELWLVFIALFICGLCVAPLWPSLLSYGAERLDYLDNTATMVLLAMAGIPGGIVFMALVGYIATVFGGLRTALYLVPTYLLIITCIILIEGRLYKDSK